MTVLINRDDAPSHLFEIPELDFSRDLCVEPLMDPWFRLGTWTISHTRDERGVEDVVMRKSLLIPSESFGEMFDRLDSVGNAVGDLGKPGGFVIHEGEQKKYGYSPFHKFEFPSTSIVAEPLVFIRYSTSVVELLINPDLWLFLGLEEKTPGSGIWWDPRNGVEALRQRVIEQDNLKIVEIRTDYLLKYIQARQLSLIIGHYRHLHLFNPSPSAIGMLIEGDVTLGSHEQGAKALIHNSRSEQELSDELFLRRSLHLWFQIKPSAIDITDPWSEQPSFDPYTSRCQPCVVRLHLLVGHTCGIVKGETSKAGCAIL
jgi:hypothetical protein